MKKKILSAAFLCMAFAAQSAMAQSEKATVRSGTQVEVQALKTIYAKEVAVGDMVDFKVLNDIKQSGKVVVPAGSIVKGVVTEAKKSSIAGTKGRLAVDFKNITLGNGEQIPLSGNVRVAGKNLTPAAVGFGIFIWPCIFITGTKAVMPEGYRATATVLANTEIVLD